MKLRTTVFSWVLLLVLVVFGVAIATLAVVFDRAAKSRLADDLARSREVTLALHASRDALYRQECHVVADEPRLRAVVATEDVEHATVADAVATLAQTLKAGVFLLVDPEGRLVADAADPKAEGFALGDRPVVAKALAGEEQFGVWLADGKAFQVAGCRLEFGARVVGALVVGHAIDNTFVQTVGAQTGGELIVVADDKPVTTLPEGITAAELGPALASLHGSGQDGSARDGSATVTLGGVHWFAAVAPVPGARAEQHVEYVVLRSLDEALAPARKIIRILVGLAAVAVLSTLLLAFSLARRLSRPIDVLVARTKAIARGDLAPMEVAGPDEVRELGSAMDRMAHEIDESRKELADKERLAQELDIAARIQTSILPRDLEVAGLEIAAKMKTASEVGGDYYDVLPLDGPGGPGADKGDGCWIAIGDASGHGLTAGLVMMMVQTGVATLVRAQPDANPKDVLATLNRVVFENVHTRLEAERHMTLSVLRYRRDGSIVVAGAHMDAVFWRAATKSIEVLATPGTFIAITDDIAHVNVERQWQLAKGDLLVLLTDGVTEAENRDGVAFGYERVTAIVEPVANEPVVAIRDRLFDELAKHSPTLVDDATILVLRYGGPA